MLRGFWQTVLHHAMHNCKGVLDYLLQQEEVRKTILVKENNEWRTLSLAEALSEWKEVK